MSSKVISPRIALCCSDRFFSNSISVSGHQAGQDGAAEVAASRQSNRAVAGQGEPAVGFHQAGQSNHLWHQLNTCQ